MIACAFISPCDSFWSVSSSGTSCGSSSTLAGAFFAADGGEGDGLDMMDKRMSKKSRRRQLLEIKQQDTNSNYRVCSRRKENLEDPETHIYYSCSESMFLYAAVFPILDSDLRSSHTGLRIFQFNLLLTDDRQNFVIKLLLLSSHAAAGSTSSAQTGSRNATI